MSNKIILTGKAIYKGKLTEYEVHYSKSGPRTGSNLKILRVGYRPASGALARAISDISGREIQSKQLEIIEDSGEVDNFTLANQNISRSKLWRRHFNVVVSKIFDRRPL